MFFVVECFSILLLVSVEIVCAIRLVCIQTVDLSCNCCSCGLNNAYHLSCDVVVGMWSCCVCRDWVFSEHISGEC